MVKNPNLDLLMENIFDDEEIVDEIMATDDMEELYRICQKVQSGYTFEEFCEFFDSLVCMCLNETKEAMDESPYEIDELSEKDLKQISGGANKFHRVTASALASLSFMTSAHIYAKDLYDADSDVTVLNSAGPGTNDVVLRDANEEDNKKPKKKDVTLRNSSDDASEEEESLGTKFKNFIDKAADVVWDNKGKILLGSIALLTFGSLLVHDHKQIGENVKAVFERKNKIEEYEEKQRKKLMTDEEWFEKSKAGNPQHEGESEEVWKKRVVTDAKKAAGLGDRPEYRSPETIRSELESKGFAGDELEKKITEALTYQDLAMKAWDIKQNQESSDIKALKESKTSDLLKEGLPLVAGVGGVGGAVGSAVKSVLEAVGKIKTHANNVKELQTTAEDIKVRAALLQKEWERKQKAKNAKNYDADKEEEKLERFFEEDFHGQEKAKAQIRDFFTLYNNERRAGADGLTESELPSPKLLVFNGPSGTGKTFTAKGLSKALTGEDGLEPYIVTANNIKQCAKSQYLGYADAFMHGNMKMDGNGGSNSAQSDNLFKYLQQTEGSVRVVILDEWDKLYEKQDGKYPEKHPLDEMFRDILDGNLKDWYQNEVDLSGTIFICTTNETKASLQGRIKLSDSGQLVEVIADEKGKPIINEFGEYSYTKPAKGDISQTVIPHETSVTNRISNICYFDGLELNDYEEIARSAIQDVRTIENVKKYKEYINSDQHKGKPIETLLYERMYYSGLDGIIISDNGYKFIAECAKEASNAARFIVGSGKDTSGSVCGNLKSAIEKHCTKIKSDKKSYKGLTLFAEPYKDTDSTGKTIVRFKITDLGYDGYDKYLKEVNNK
ncbi:MAG: AAA family ATPase [Clostridia bacterium]|nr:AAA family ATPase [Clostridia bacterium]